MTYEDIFLESRFHMPKPTGMLLGFNDPLWSRLIISKIAPYVYTRIDKRNYFE